METSDFWLQDHPQGPWPNMAKHVAVCHATLKRMVHEKKNPIEIWIIWWFTSVLGHLHVNRPKFYTWNKEYDDERVGCVFFLHMLRHGHFFGHLRIFLRPW